MFYPLALEHSLLQAGIAPGEFGGAFFDKFIQVLMVLRQFFLHPLTLGDVSPDRLKFPQASLLIKDDAIRPLLPANAMTNNSAKVNDRDLSKRCKDSPPKSSTIISNVFL